MEGDLQMVKKGSGWHNESKRHALAVQKGLKTRFAPKKKVVKKSVLKFPLKFVKSNWDLEFINASHEWNIKNPIKSKRIGELEKLYLKNAFQSGWKLDNKQQKDYDNFGKERLDYGRKKANLWGKNQQTAKQKLFKSPLHKSVFDGVWYISLDLPSEGNLIIPGFENKFSESFNSEVDADKFIKTVNKNIEKKYKIKVQPRYVEEIKKKKRKKL